MKGRDLKIRKVVPKMIETEIPGWKRLEISNLVLDFNGTIAEDGKLIAGVAERLEQISKMEVELFVITADTNGTVKRECERLPVKVLVYQSDCVAVNKRELVQKLGARQTASIGNGKNDGQMFEASELSIAVIGKEGCCCASMTKADIWVNNILDALDLLIVPSRLKATLRG